MSEKVLYIKHCYQCPFSTGNGWRCLKAHIENKPK